MYTIGPVDITAEASHMSATTKYDAQVKGKRTKRNSPLILKLSGIPSCWNMNKWKEKESQL